MRMTPRQRLMHGFMCYIHNYAMTELQCEYRHEEEKKKLAAEKRKLAKKKKMRQARAAGICPYCAQPKKGVL